MAKLGFINTDVNKISCCFPQCKVSIKCGPHLNFASDEKAALNMYKKIK
jgi:hypothetical protein